MKYVSGLIVFALVFTASMLVMELYMQLAEIKNPLETRIDPKLGPTYVSSLKITRFKEGFNIGGTNEYGYLGEGSPRKRVGDECRILVMGDSFVVGGALLERHHFIHTVEQELGEVAGRRVDAMNFGRPGFTLENMYTYYRNFASEFDHDLALFFVGTRDLAPSHRSDRDLYPMCELQDETLLIDYGFRASAKCEFYQKIEPISSRSAFCRLALNLRKSFKRGDTAKLVLDRFHRFLVSNPKPVVNRANEETVLSAIVTAILGDLARSDANILVYRSDIPQELRKAVEATGIRFIDLSPTLKAMEEQGRNPYYWRASGDMGHWNHDAHLEIGHQLTRSLAAYIGAVRAARMGQAESI